MYVAQSWPWENSSLDEMELAYRRMRAMFEFLDKLGAEYWCFHDRCVATFPPCTVPWEYVLT